MVTLPLTNTMEAGYDKIAKVMTGVKNSFLLIYATYFMSKLAAIFVPKTIPRRLIDD